uniref:Granulins domain-containing protein n=1 Tax=Setaria viridis TaxID=4556 RepID=A0A4U6U459_SETVI|nr:hypothetical protein SEVIR_6G119800v2 [Setaria viridis]
MAICLVFLLAAGASRGLTAVALAFLLLLASPAAAARDTTTWLARYRKAYKAAVGGEKYDRRFRAFWDNLRFVDVHNAGAGTRGYCLGMNRFADLTNEEFRAAYLSASATGGGRGRGAAVTIGERYRHDGVEALPECVDWRQKGAVAHVKNQGQCIVTGDLVTLSEQELVDCSKNGQNSGCNGGMMDDAFAFIARNGGIDTDEDYPYTARDGRCDLAKKARKVISINGFEDVPSNDEMSLQKAVAHQPVTVGVFTGRCGTSLDHGVVEVGYGTDEDGNDYWLVRNSWGADWGEAGYIRMKRNVTARTGKCGIAMEASYPVKDGPNPIPAPPSPVVPQACLRHSTCPTGSTCCCTYGVRNVCLVWGCCPAEGATCCKDHSTCCPADHSVCNAKTRTCSNSKNSSDTVEAMLRFPAKRQRGLSIVEELVRSLRFNLLGTA